MAIVIKNLNFQIKYEYNLFYSKILKDIYVNVFFFFQIKINKRQEN